MTICWTQSYYILINALADRVASVVAPCGCLPAVDFIPGGILPPSVCVVKKGYAICCRAALCVLDFLKKMLKCRLYSIALMLRVFETFLIHEWHVNNLDGKRRNDKIRFPNKT